MSDGRNLQPFPPLDPTVEALNEQASAWIREGLAIFDEGAADAPLRALAHFERALDVRRRLPTSSSPLLQYDLAGTWLNRAAALMAIDAVQASEALHSCDEAIAVMRQLPLGADPRFPRRLAIAHQNRGLAHLAHGPQANYRAIQDFIDAIAVLESDESEAIDDRRYLLSALWVSLADIQANGNNDAAWRRAMESATHGRTLVADDAFTHVGAADVSLKGCHVCCRALARCLTAAAVDGRLVEDDVHAATDTAEDGLRLIEHWEQQGVHVFTPIGRDLFAFGSRVYETYQPQFLAEFQEEHRFISELTAD
jgi:tetratricopeptide (TPR) repeat protein